MIVMIRWVTEGSAGSCESTSVNEKGLNRYHATPHFGEKGGAGVKLDSPVPLHR